MIKNLADFNNKLNIHTYNFKLRESSIVTSQEGSGNILRADSGYRLWTGNVALATTDVSKGRMLQALIEELQEGGNFFVITDKQASRPISWQLNDGLSTSSVTMVNPQPGNVANLAGLPSGYVLQAGDKFSYVRNGVHRLHRIVGETATASAGGNVTVSVLPALPVISGTIGITLIDPRVTAQLIPGSVSDISIQKHRVDGISFSWIQTVKV